MLQSHIHVRTNRHQELPEYLGSEITKMLEAHFTDHFESLIDTDEIVKNYGLDNVKNFSVPLL